jgi:hypothetical protein
MEEEQAQGCTEDSGEHRSEGHTDRRGEGPSEQMYLAVPGHFSEERSTRRIDRHETDRRAEYCAAEGRNPERE